MLGGGFERRRVMGVYSSREFEFWFGGLIQFNPDGFVVNTNIQYSAVDEPALIILIIKMC